MKKDFDDFSNNQSKDLYALYFQAIKEIDELFDSAKENDKFQNALSNIPPWSHFYELPFSITISVIILGFDLAEEFKRIANSNDSLQEIIYFIGNLPDKSDQMKSLSDEDRFFLLSTIRALLYQFQSINMYGKTLSDLVKFAKDGNNEALFDAILVDNSAISTPSLANIIHKTQAANDTIFKNKLAKALSDKKPKRPRPNKLDDDLRFMLTLLDEQFGLLNKVVTGEKLFDLLAEDLQLYPRGNKEGTAGGLGKYIQRFSNKYRT